MVWQHLVFAAMDWQWLLAGVLCVCAAAGLWQQERAPAAGRWGAVVAGAAGLWMAAAMPLTLACFKLAQSRAFGLMWDSGVFGNLVWDAGHGRGLVSSVIGGRSYLGVHFTGLPYVLAPLLRLYPSIDTLAVFQGLAVGSAIPAVYLLSRRLLDDRVEAAALTLLAASTLYFHDLSGAVLDNSLYALPLSLWGLWLAQRGQRAAAAAAAAAALLLLATREQAPLLLAGCGLWLAAERRGKGRAAGLLLAAAMAALFLAELTVIRRQQALWDSGLTRWKGLFGGLGATPEVIARNLASRPWRLPSALFWPYWRLRVPLEVLFSLALLPLWAGWAALPAAAAWLPNQLANDGTFHQLRMHYAAFVYGPLLFACARGMVAWNARWPGARARRRLAAVVLLAAGAQFMLNADFRSAEGLMPARWQASVPEAEALIPPDAAVWADEFLLPQMSMRPRLKSLPKHLPDPQFETGLFTPDYVLMSLHWGQRADPPVRERILSFLRRAGLVVVFRDQDLVLWARRPGAEALSAAAF